MTAEYNIRCRNKKSREFGEVTVMAGSKKEARRDFHEAFGKSNKLVSIKCVNVID